MSNHPQMPASTPILQQRVVRGDSVRRLPGKVVSEHIEFSWIGLVDHLDTSMPHPVTIGGAFTEIAVAFTTPAVIDFDILVNGSIEGSITTAATGDLQTFTATLILVRDDLVQLDLTDFGTGLAEGVAVKFRNPA
jgi:hypothetical protein